MRRYPEPLRFDQFSLSTAKPVRLIRTFKVSETYRFKSNQTIIKQGTRYLVPYPRFKKFQVFQDLEHLKEWETHGYCESIEVKE